MRFDLQIEPQAKLSALFQSNLMHNYNNEDKHYQSNQAKNFEIIANQVYIEIENLYKLIIILYNNSPKKRIQQRK